MNYDLIKIFYLLLSPKWLINYKLFHEFFKIEDLIMKVTGAKEK